MGKPPGDYIREELAKRGWGQDDLARVLDKPTSRVNELIQGRLLVSPEIAVALAAALGGTPHEWLSREAQFRLSAAPEAESIRKRARLYELGPLKEMQKRGWIRASDSTDRLEQEVLRFYKIGSVDEEPSLHGAMRKSGPSITATPAQRAWAFRVRQIAGAIPPAAVGPFEESRIGACQRELRKLASYSTEVKKAPSLLLHYGIRFVAVEGLPGAKLDGWATWLDEESPVIGMSLRFDRLDSFWFTLGHEVVHLKYRDVAPIDADVAGIDELPLDVKPPFERRADEESAAMFVPPEELDSFIRRVGPLYSTDKINQFSNKIKMHPSVVVGQLKHRGEIKRTHHNKTNVPIREVVVKSAVTDGWGKTIDEGALP